MKTLMDVTVGDFVVVSGGHWSSKDSVERVEHSTPAKLTVKGVIYTRKTGAGPRNEDRFGSRLFIRVATDEDIENAKLQRRGRKAVAVLSKMIGQNIDPGILKLYSPGTIEAVNELLRKSNENAVNAGGDE